MKYKNIILTLIGGFAILLGTVQNTYANVDQTNAFNFEYNCIEGVGTLKTVFDLGGHHLYYRQYNIEKPGIIEIADSAHTTVSKNSNISISGCNYEVNSCNVSSMSAWEIDREVNEKIITIDTQESIVKAGNNIIINGSGSENTISIEGFENSYTSTGKTIQINFLEEKVELIENETLIQEINFENGEFDGNKELYYEFAENNTNITLKKRIFKRGGNGITKSSPNNYDIYGAFAGNNFGHPVSTTNNGYHTTLDYWDYTQHYYTTTKVKLHPVDLSCSKTEYSDGQIELSVDAYEGTLGGIIQPEFGGDITFNQKTLDSFGGGIIPASEELLVKGLQYTTVGKIGNQKIAIEEIQVSLKENDITLGKDNIILRSTKSSVGGFGDMSLSIQNESGDIITKQSGNYQIVFTFFSNSQQVGTYELPLLIIPNNNLQGVGGVSIQNNNVLADNSQTIQVCQSITDSFGNIITRNHGNFSSNIIKINNGIYNNALNQSGGEAINISNTTFNNSEICFDMTSKAPEEKRVDFDIDVPTHKEDVSLAWDGGYTTISGVQTNGNVVFEKPFVASMKVSNDEGDTWNDIPVIGTKQNYKIDFIQSLGGVSYSLNISESTIQNEIPGHFFEDFSRLEESTFETRIDANENVLTAPSITIDNLVIGYTLGGSFVQYYLDNTKISGDDQETLGLKVVGTLQGGGKSELTGQNENFSDLSQSEVRANIRKDAYIAIKGQESETIVNGIKYVKGDVTVSGDEEYETLIVKDGNVIIAGDINTTLGIIVLKDNYNVESDFANKGNVYIQANVGYIDTIIYADGGIISADYEGNPYILDSSARTSDLQKQLVLKGSVFTRNTIGGAVLAGETYKLPGGGETTDFDNAMIYDLNYTRRGNKERDATKNNGHTQPFVIIYNPEVQNNPPKGF